VHEINGKKGVADIFFLVSDFGERVDGVVSTIR
jgi:hypothetical protein